MRWHRASWRFARRGFCWYAIALQGTQDQVKEQRHEAGRARDTDMNSENVRSIQKSLKNGYREEPGKAMVTLKAQGRLGEKAG